MCFGPSTQWGKTRLKSSTKRRLTPILLNKKIPRLFDTSSPPEHTEIDNHAYKVAVLGSICFDICNLIGTAPPRPAIPAFDVVSTMPGV